MAGNRIRARCLKYSTFTVGTAVKNWPRLDRRHVACSGLVVAVNDLALNDRKILRRKPIPRRSVAGGGQSRILIAPAGDSDIEFDPRAIGGGGGGASWSPASVLD
jgi:hypothetical protein